MSVSIRDWSVRHARTLERLWAAIERLLIRLGPAFAALGPGRLERPVAAVERAVKGALFGCRMCGQCILGSTGMSCPMNCPKGLRNGPCGGVGADGRCEVKPEMVCVWVRAWEGSRRMAETDRIGALQPALDHRLWQRSSWLRVALGPEPAPPRR
jgi:hypothetical protein